MIADQRHFPVALIVPDFAALRAHAEEGGIPVESDAEICRDSHFIQLVQAEVDRFSEGFAPYERVKRFALLDKSFSIGDGEVTPTMKLKRKVIGEKYRELIDSLYEGHGQGGSEGVAAQEESVPQPEKERQGTV
jgi:long-chain acyl-CoA synthetase